MEQKKLEILVIEDKSHHLEDVKRMLKQRQESGASISVSYVSTLEEAYAKMPEADAIISDVFFPEQEGEEPVMQAYKIREKAEELGKHLVFCTDGDHHGPHLQELTSKGFLHKDGKYLGMVDFAIQHPQRTKEVIESRMKIWPKAYLKVMEAIDPKEAEDFEAHIESLGIDTDEIFHSYYGPSYTDLEKVLRDSSGKKPAQEIKILWGHYMLDKPMFKRHLEIDYKELFQSHKIQVTYTSSEEEFTELAKNGDFDIAVACSYWGGKSWRSEKEESLIGKDLLSLATHHIPRTVLMMEDPDPEMEASAKDKGISYCTSLRPSPKRMEKALFEI